jgi:thymidine kinase
MFAGKSTAIISIIKKNKYMNIDTFCITSILDTRYNINSISTHTNETYPAYSVKNLHDISKSEEYIKATHVIIEEAQFFTDLKEFVLHAVEIEGKHVVCVGLDGDSDRRPFGQILDLIPYCDFLTKLTAICTRCKDRALFTFRQCGEITDQVFVAGPDKYEALCRKHYLTATTGKTAELSAL